ncbi:MAG: exosortase/archaeosortase family protein [Syntrophales bacterium]|nr:exosortase/archaeosortase family protein [Syntrophales bacterium]MDD5533570.1 exosortase/archaeosortase family protein [Syntrophales bacterium]
MTGIREYYPVLVRNREKALWSAIFLAGIAAIYAPMAVNLVRDWMNLPDFNHGFLIPIVSGYIVFLKRTRLAELLAEAPAGERGGALLIAAGIFMLAAGRLANEHFVMRLSLPLIMAGSIRQIFGRAVLCELVFPIAYLVFMFPIPSILMEKITFPLQLVASGFAAILLDSAGVPVLREGNIIQLPDMSLEVAEACSGIRSLISLLALSAVFAYLFQKRQWKRAILVLSAVPTAMITNIIRVTGTGVLAHKFGGKAAQGFYHDFSGWLVFVVAFAFLAGINRMMAARGRSQ